MRKAKGKDKNNKHHGSSNNKGKPNREKKRQRDPHKWKGHFEKFNEMLELKALRLEDIEGDGNCLFRSVSDQLFGHENKHRDLRRACVEYMADNKDLLQHFIDEDEDLGFDDYLAWIAKDTNWAGYFEIYCLAQLLRVNFSVILKDGSVISYNHFSPFAVRTLVLAFHEDEANGIPEHYSSVRLLTDDRKSGISPQIPLDALQDMTAQTDDLDDSKNMPPPPPKEKEEKFSNRKMKKMEEKKKKEKKTKGEKEVHESKKSQQIREKNTSIDTGIDEESSAELLQTLEDLGLHY